MKRTNKVKRTNKMKRTNKSADPRYKLTKTEDS